jgi:hypothetical protein
MSLYVLYVILITCKLGCWYSELFLLFACAPFCWSRRWTKAYWTATHILTVAGIGATFGIFSARSKWFPVGRDWWPWTKPGYITMNRRRGNNQWSGKITTHPVPKIRIVKICSKISRLDFLGSQRHPPHLLSSKGPNFATEVRVFVGDLALSCVITVPLFHSSTTVITTIAMLFVDRQQCYVTHTRKMNTAVKHNCLIFVFTATCFDWTNHHRTLLYKTFEIQEYIFNVNCWFSDSWLV